MKANAIILVVLAMFLAACHKDTQIDPQTPVVTETKVEVFATEVNFEWKVDFPGKMSSVVKLGKKADMSDAVSYGSDAPTSKKDFTAAVSGLTKSTTYYYCYETWNPKVRVKSEVFNFTTMDDWTPTVTTFEVTDIINVSAIGGGKVTSDGGHPVTERGVCWSTEHDPTIEGSHASAGEGTGSFTVNMSDLTAVTTYYVRAYAINSLGTSYGDEVSFETAGETASVTTLKVTNITQVSATGGGVVTSDGGYPVIERGVCWSTEHDPTIEGSHASAGEGTGEFTVDMTGLTPNTTYYVRAYVINSMGANYGSEVTFETVFYPVGTIKGVFTVGPNSSDKVFFSQGNLQYIGSSNTWKFADNQWDVIGTSQSTTSQSVTRDLFGWGTSGWNCGNSYYRPYDTNNSDGSLYGPKGNYNLTGNYEESDWGAHNTISNAGSGWRTLTKDEWLYVFNIREGSYLNGVEYARYVKAMVNNKAGVILFPDNYTHPSGVTGPSGINTPGSAFNLNSYQGDSWSLMEEAGCVFLPAAGYRSASIVSDVNSFGYYWSATSSNGSQSSCVKFSLTEFVPNYISTRYYGRSVRLVKRAL